MVTLQDIADKVGVSRTTVSNVLHGNTKRVSKQTMDKISKILEQEGYVPNMGSLIMTKNSSRIIGLTLGSSTFHHMHALQTPFISEFLSKLQLEAESHGYYVMIISGKEVSSVVDIASRWNIDGLILFAFSEEKYRLLTQKLNKSMVLIDYYPSKGFFHYNVGIDDYSGGYLIGDYLYNNNHKSALFIAETKKDSDYQRWLGFKDAQEQNGEICTSYRYNILNPHLSDVKSYYQTNLEKFIEARALAFSSDYRAMEAMQNLFQLGVNIPDDISITGFDDSLYCKFARPALTTIKQNVRLKAQLAFSQLLKIINNELITEASIHSPVELVIRNSVKPY
ncbi:MAG: transcriptional regulator [Epulopiscium sp. Nuni2H_MBin001]|nr:MAG: transcriptional regulator [Epulopiscium sp. Nuni2H_MBin001]